MSDNLTCPHGCELVIELEEGIAVYRHREDHAYCEVLNSFVITPEEVLTVTMTAILQRRDYAHYVQLGQTLAELENGLKVRDARKSRITEFVIMFKRNAQVRSLIYAEIAQLSEQGEVEAAQQLMTLVLLILLDKRVRADDRRYQLLLGELFKAYGRSYSSWSARLAICRQGTLNSERLEQLQKDISFQGKYVFPLQKVDQYQLNW